MYHLGDLCINASVQAFSVVQAMRCLSKVSGRSSWHERGRTMKAMLSAAKPVSFVPEITDSSFKSDLLRAKVDSEGQRHRRDESRANLQTPRNVAHLIDGEVRAEAKKDTKSRPHLP